MGNRQFQLSETEIGQFRQAEAQTGEVRELKRLQALRLYGSGVSIGAIMDVVGAGESSIRQWAMAYNREGLAGLRSKWQGKNANKLTDEQRRQLKARLHENRPLDLHISQGEYWTVSDLQVAVEQWFGVAYKDHDSYQGLLKASGFSYQRTTQTYRSKPSATQIATFEAEVEKK